MRKLLLPAVATLAVCIPAAAQDHFTPSPQSGGPEGSFSVDLIGSASSLRFQQIDGLTLGSKTDRNRIAFRRDGVLATNPAYVARDLTVTVRFGEGNLATAGSNFDANYIGGTMTEVITSKTISLSGWEAAPAVPPAGHGDAWPFDVLHSYLGKTATGNDWVWEVQVHSNTQAGQPYPMDADIVMPTQIDQGGAAVGFGGCGISTSSSFSNHGTKFSWAMGLGGADASVPAFFMIGGPANAQVPGWCGPFETDLFLVVPVGNTDLTGAVSVNFDPITYVGAAIGGALEVQSLVFQPSSPGSIGIGQTRSQTIPVDPPAAPAAKHHWATSDTATTSTSGLVNGGIILWTNHP